MTRGGMWEKEEKRGCFKVRKESSDDMGMDTCGLPLPDVVCVRSQRSITRSPVAAALFPYFLTIKSKKK